MTIGCDSRFFQHVLGTIPGTFKKNCNLEIVRHCTVRTMSNEDGVPPTQETTGDSEANRQRDNGYVSMNLPNYLINPPKKGEDANFLSNM